MLSIAQHAKNLPGVILNGLTLLFFQNKNIVKQLI